MVSRSSVTNQQTRLATAKEVNEFVDICWRTGKKIHTYNVSYVHMYECMYVCSYEVHLQLHNASASASL